MSLRMCLAVDVEEMSQHPEIENVYNRRRSSLCKTDAGSKITEKGPKLTEHIEDLVKVG
ncbi:MAG: hypothetical protein ACPGKS_08365 [Coraliomargarita sp.]